MPMTIKTGSRKVGTALRFEVQSERNGSAIDDIQGSGRIQTEHHIPIDNQVCTKCGTEINFRHLSTPRLLELISSCVWVVFLIAIMFFVGGLLSSWAEHGFEVPSDHLVWHEPLNDWNLRFSSLLSNAATRSEGFIFHDGDRLDFV